MKVVKIVKRGCCYCEDMHLGRCPDAFTEVSQYCGNYEQVYKVAAKSKDTAAERS